MQEKENDEIEIDLGEVFSLLLSKLWLILLVTVVAGAAGFLISTFLITPKYESTTSAYILNKDTGNTITYGDTQLASQLTKDYEELIKGRSVLEKVMADFDITEESYESFSKRVTVTNPTGTRIIAVTVKDKDPEMAQELADDIRITAAGHIQEVTDVEAVNVAEVANLPVKPSEPNVVKWTLLWALIGALLCIAILIIRYLTDDTIKSADDIEKYLGLSTLALIPDSDVTEKNKKKRKSGKGSNRKEEKLKEQFRREGIELIDADEIGE